jgi:hypothetical protein
MVTVTAVASVQIAPMAQAGRFSMSWLFPPRHWFVRDLADDRFETERSADSRVCSEWVKGLMLSLLTVSLLIGCMEYVPSGYYGGYSAGYVGEPAYVPQYEPTYVPQYPPYVPQYPRSPTTNGWGGDRPYHYRTGEMTTGWIGDQPFNAYSGGEETTEWVGDQPIFVSQ